MRKINRISRILLFLYSIVSIVILGFLLIILLEITPYYLGFGRLYYEYKWIKYVISGLLAAYFLFSVVLFFISIFSKGKRNFIYYKMSQGEIKVSKTAISGAILSVIGERINTENIKLRVKYNKSEIKTIKIAVYNSFLDRMPTLLEEMQNQIKETLERTLEIKSDKINFIITGKSAKENDSRRDSRVI